MEKNMSLKARLNNTKQKKQFKALCRMESQATYDEEYINYYDMNEIKSNLDGYSEYLDDRKLASDWY